MEVPLTEMAETVHEKRRQDGHEMDNLQNEPSEEMVMSKIINNLLGIINTGEDWDDSNQDGGDGCNSNWEEEQEWNWVGEPSSCYRWGNGISLT